MTEAEFQFLDFIQQNFRTPAGDAFMVAVTTLGNAGAVWILLGILLLLRKKHRKTGIILLAALFIDFLVCNIYLKNLIQAPRPCELNTAVQLLISRPSDYSFPSGHTASSFAAVTVFFLQKEKFWPAALVLALLIAFSRMYLYVHFPSDITGGILTGIACAVLTRTILQGAWRRFKKHTVKG